MIVAKQANYIKLGEKGCYEKFCFENGVLALGFHEAPHDEPFHPQSTYDMYQSLGYVKRTCTSFMNQVTSFYEAGEEVLWFTFAHGKLYWCIVTDGVEIITLDPNAPGPSRFRKTVDGWHDSDITGYPIYIAELNGNLTKAMSYQSTTFTLDVARCDYLINRINGKELPEVVRARENKRKTLSSIVDMMRLLNPYDFELLVDLVFAQSGWQRISASGGVQKTVDLELYLPSTGDCAFVQVKSETNQRQLEEYEAEIDKRNERFMFYVYHTAKKPLTATHSKTQLVDANRLADMVLNAGLFDWLLKKAR